MEPPARPLPRGRRAARRGRLGAAAEEAAGARRERPPAPLRSVPAQGRPIGARPAKARTCRVSGARDRCRRGHHCSHFHSHRGRCAEPRGFVCVLPALAPAAAAAVTPELGSPDPLTARHGAEGSEPGAPKALGVKLPTKFGFWGEPVEVGSRPGWGRMAEDETYLRLFLKAVGGGGMSPRSWNGGCLLGEERGGHLGHRGGARDHARRSGFAEFCEDKVWFFGGFLECPCLK